MEDVIVIRTDGRSIVAVQRTDIDLDSAEGRELALSDNRASELGLSWNSDVLDELQSEGLDLSGLFTGEEMDALLGELGAGERLPESPGADWMLAQSGPHQSEPGRIGVNGTVMTEATRPGVIVMRDGVGGPDAAMALRPAGSEEGPSAAPSPPPAPGGSAAQAAASRAQRPLGPQGPPPTPVPLSIQPGHAHGTAGTYGIGDAPPVEFKEFDESVAAGVSVHRCPACGNRWAE